MSAELVARAHAALAAVCDPEIPVLSLADLGVLRGVALEGSALVVTLTPTYSGCPAMAHMEADVRAALAPLVQLMPAGSTVQVRTQLAPAWTTDWMNEAAREKLRAYGIAPPGAVAAGGTASKVVHFAMKTGAARAASAAQNAEMPIKTEPQEVRCPQCGSADTTEVSHFASTACKALYKCLACMEPFDHFKPY